jgi:hypothetical protein
MTTSFQFTFNNSHLTFIDLFSFNQRQMPLGKLMANGKWQMANARGAQR